MFNGVAESYAEALKDVNTDVDTLVDEAETQKAKVEYFQKIYDETWAGLHGNGEARLTAYEALGLQAEEMQSLINKGPGYTITLDDVIDFQWPEPAKIAEKIPKPDLTEVYKLYYAQLYNAKTEADFAAARAEVKAALTDAGIAMTNEIAVELKKIEEHVKKGQSTHFSADVPDDNLSSGAISKIKKRLGDNITELDKVIALYAILETQLAGLSTDSEEWAAAWKEFEDELYEKTGLKLDGNTKLQSDIIGIVDQYGSCMEYLESELDTGPIVEYRNAYNDAIASINEAFGDGELRISEIETLRDKLIEVAKMFNGVKNVLSEDEIAGQEALAGIHEKLIAANYEILSSKHRKMKVEDFAKDLIAAEYEILDLAKDIGEATAQGYITGMGDDSHLNEINKNACNMGNVAINALKKILDINSPSKVFYKLGLFTIQGFINALRDGETDIIDVAEGYMTKVINKIAEIANSDIDTQPTIRPVLDLSDFDSGSSRLTSIFEKGMPVGLLGKADSLSVLMNSRDGFQNDVVSAINSLRTDIKNIKTNTYNVNGVTYDDGSNVSNAVKTLIRAAKIERRT